MSATVVINSIGWLVGLAGLVVLLIFALRSQWRAFKEANRRMRGDKP